VNIFGFLDSESGVGEAARTLIRAVDQAGIPSALLNSPRVPHRRNENQFSKRFAKTNPYRVNLIAIYGDMFGIELENFGEERFAGKYNIAYWAWELPEMPPEWGKLLDRVNEVWVPSSFVADAVKRLRPDIPVTVIPHAIEVGRHPFPRAHFELPEGHILFLSMFDFFSIFERKNPLAAIRAFKEAFSSEELVHLVIKCSNPKVEPKNFRLLEDAAKGHNIHLIPRYLAREEIASLLNVCDCYVSLHRSEGFGLPLAEAMALRKPVIATNWSGNADFMNEMNSFPINYKLVPLKRDYGIYRQGNEWAEPDEHEAARRMRLIYENREIAARKGMVAQSDIIKKFSPNAVGRLIAKNLRRIRRDLKSNFVRIPR
jgi:glycosyltransferase involved in cell wall biosynthesis